MSRSSIQTEIWSERLAALALHTFGLDHNGSLETLEGAIRAACSDGGVDADSRPIAHTAVYCVAGADIPVDDRRIAAELGGRGWAKRTIVRNDTFAMLACARKRGWGVAVVCGTGLNCAGVVGCA